MNRALEMVAVGPSALVQDLGRPGLGASGVGRSGAADRASLTLANRLVANAEGAAAVEVLLGGLAVRATSLLTVALSGAAAPASVDGTPVGHHAVVDLRPGQVLRLGTPPTGLRTAAGGRRRGAERGDGPERGPGAAGRRAGRVPRRPSGDGRVPCGRHGARRRCRPRGAGAAGGSECGSSSPPLDPEVIDPRRQRLSAT